MGPRGKLCLRCCHAEKSDSLVYGCRKRRRSEECQLLSRQPIPPGSSSLSPRNPTPSKATRTEQENVRNSPDTFAHCFACSHPYGVARSAAGPEDATALLNIEGPQGWDRGGYEQRIRAILAVEKRRGERQEWYTAEGVSHPG